MPSDAGQAKDVESNLERFGVLVAYEVCNPKGMPILVPPRSREWMEGTEQSFALRCLPMVLANQSGWFIANPVSFTARWTGGNRKEDLAVEFDKDRCDDRVQSHFGHGILTFTLPYLFRTPPGINLLVRGPSNQIKDGIQALEGVVETDWAVSPFTMNWKFTRPDHDVRFEAGEPICMIVPLQRGLAESLTPVRAPLKSNQELHAAYHEWRTRRNGFLDRLSKGEAETVREGWQKDYFKGVDMQGQRIPEHQTQIDLREFSESPI